MPKLQCKECNYEFDKEKTPNRCPYCGANKSIIPYKTAQDHLDESNN